MMFSLDQAKHAEEDTDAAHTVGPPYPRLLHPRFNQPWIESIREKNSRNFQKGKLEFAVCRPLFTLHLHYICNYLHNTYIVLGSISNLEMI